MLLLIYEVCPLWKIHCVERTLFWKATHVRPYLPGVLFAGHRQTGQTKIRHHITHWRKFKISKILNFQKSRLKTCIMPTIYSLHKMKFKWSIVLDIPNINQRTYYNLLNSSSKVSLKIQNWGIILISLTYLIRVSTVFWHNALLDFE